MNSEHLVTKPHGTPEANPQAKWMAYFVLTIIFFGGTLCIPFAGTFYAIGRLFRPATRIGDFFLILTVKWLLLVQPWLKAQVQVPKFKTGRGALIVSNHRSTLDAF